jgi:hypothetical protein
MGNNYSCYNCFSKELQGQTIENSTSAYPYDNSSLADSNFNRNKPFENETMEESYTESEALSKTELIDTISKTMQKFLEDIRQDPEKLGYKKVLTQNAVEVLLKDVPGGYSLMSIWKCSFPAEKVASFLRLVDKRKDWDSHVSECKKICDISSDIAVYYTLYKRFLTMAPRDVLIVGQQLHLEDAWVDVSTSINSSLVPETTSIVRAKVVLAGYYMQTIPKDESGNITLVTSVSEANFGQSLASGIVKNMSTNLTPKFVKAMIEGMKKFDAEL